MSSEEVMMDAGILCDFSSANVFSELLVENC